MYSKSAFTNSNLIGKKISKNYGPINITIRCLLSIIFLVGVILETKRCIAKVPSPTPIL
jgi:hypothetical protein